jgi:Asp-tRNA(Asn)/Glu-tRNA(Gln) amidotransferase A subunit family amidase
MDDIVSFASHAARFRSGQASPTSLLETYLARIDGRESEVKAFVELALDSARDQAKASEARWRAGTELSAIDGMPVGIKDIIETADMPTGQGSPLWTGHRSERDSATVQALRDAGAIIIGKTVTTEFAASIAFGKTVNPHDPARTPGGSSSGSAAAVGAGFVPVALGSQVVGSTLRPASYCGCIGFKPSFGAINRGGSYDYLSHSSVGVLGVTLDDVWLTSKAIVNRTGGDPGYVGLTGPEELPEAHRPKRLLVLQTAGWSKMTPGAATALNTALEQLSERGVELIDGSGAQELVQFDRMIAEIRNLSNTILQWESRWPLGGYIKSDAGKLSPTVVSRYEAGKILQQTDYARALEERDRLRSAYAELLRDADGVITLAATGAAPIGFANTGDSDFNIPASVLGVPAISLPLLHDESLPLGLQLMGKSNRDADLFGMGRWITSSL